MLGVRAVQRLISPKGILESVHVSPVTLRSGDLKLNSLAAKKCNAVSQAKIN